MGIKAIRSVNTAEQQASQQDYQRKELRKEHKKNTEDLSSYTFDQLSSKQKDDALKTLLITNGLISPD